MPLGLAFGFAMVGVSFEDWLPHKYYSHAGNLRILYSCTLWRFGAWYQIFVGPLATRRECHTSLKRRVWASERTQIINFAKKCKAALHSFPSMLITFPRSSWGSSVAFIYYVPACQIFWVILQFLLGVRILPGSSWTRIWRWFKLKVTEIWLMLVWAVEKFGSLVLNKRSGFWATNGT